MGRPTGIVAASKVSMKPSCWTLKQQSDAGLDIAVSHEHGSSEGQTQHVFHMCRTRHWPGLCSGYLLRPACASTRPQVHQAVRGLSRNMFCCYTLCSSVP